VPKKLVFLGAHQFCNWGYATVKPSQMPLVVADILKYLPDDHESASPSQRPQIRSNEWA
jgi:hypothetical protein